MLFIAGLFWQQGESPAVFPSRLVQKLVNRNAQTVLERGHYCSALGLGAIDLASHHQSTARLATTCCVQELDFAEVGGQQRGETRTLGVGISLAKLKRPSTKSTFE